LPKLAHKNSRCVLLRQKSYCWRNKHFLYAEKLIRHIFPVKYGAFFYKIELITWTIRAGFAAI